MGNDTEFKSGDLVRCVRADISWFTEGKIYKVGDVDIDNCVVVVADDDGDPTRQPTYCFEPVTLPVGAKVKFTDECSSSWFFGPHTDHKDGVISVVCDEGSGINYGVDIAGMIGWVDDKHIDVVDPFVGWDKGPDHAFKIGDRVRLTADNGGFGAEGDEGEVVDITQSGILLVRFDREIRGDGKWYVMPRIAAPVLASDGATSGGTTFRVGDRVKSRDGDPTDAVGTVVEVDYSSYLISFDGWTGGHSGGGKTPDYSGWWLPASRLDRAPANDNEPTDPAVSAFRVGMKIRAKDSDWCNGYVAGDVLTITRVNGDCAFFRDNDGDERLVYNEIFDIVDDDAAAISPVWIVAKMDGTQPKPSLHPCVHPSKSAAEAEASRLANVIKGAEFAVFEMVANRKVEKTYDYEWQRLAACGRKIEAIKMLRSMTGMGLATTKDAVDDWLKREAA
ncbi:hypothetical protein [Consotaella salsifontis]|uniref:Uncharacterized protein n=1 Tax=Consotaella salsifontis TaxID=1365950 RepID=A0A1T4RW50_9HYPH|nr:hypothetical protein [Consotaella salsifontis]SKA20192.1 hypothetical protein SAMN05428963_10821 [Consotaella salsifontis]